MANTRPKTPMKAIPLRLPIDLYERVNRYRFSTQVPTESEALRSLLDAGLRSWEQREPGRKTKAR